MTSLQKLRNRLEKIEAELEKVRGCSPLTHGWQTQKYAKASRKWDMLAQEKQKILQRLEEFDGFAGICEVSGKVILKSDAHWRDDDGVTVLKSEWNGE